MLFFDALLDPLVALSCSFQGSSADLPLAVANLKTFESAVAKLKEDTPETSTKLTQLVAAATCEGEAVFCKTKLSGVSTAVRQAFKNNRAPLVNKMFTNRFDDLQTIDAIKGVRLLNFTLWPIDTAAFDTFGDLEVSFRYW